MNISGTALRRGRTIIRNILFVQDKNLPILLDALQFSVYKRSYRLRRRRPNSGRRRLVSARLRSCVYGARDRLARKTAARSGLWPLMQNHFRNHEIILKSHFIKVKVHNIVNIILTVISSMLLRYQLHITHYTATLIYHKLPESFPLHSKPFNFKPEFGQIYFRVRQKLYLALSH